MLLLRKGDVVGIMLAGAGFQAVRSAQLTVRVYFPVYRALPATISSVTSNASPEVGAFGASSSTPADALWLT